MRSLHASAQTILQTKTAAGRRCLHTRGLPIAQNAGKLKILSTEFVSEDYAIGVSKDNTALRDAVNNALKELIDDGTVQAILDQYIKAE